MVQRDARTGAGDLCRASPSGGPGSTERQDTALSERRSLAFAIEVSYATSQQCLWTLRTSWVGQLP